MPVVELVLDSKGALIGAKEFDVATKRVGAATDDALSNMDKFRAKVNAMGPMIAAAGAAIGAALVGAAAHTIQLASDLEETQNKFDVVFAGMTEQAESWATHLQKNYMMTTEESKRFMASTQDLLKPMGVATDQAGEMSFATAKLAADLGSFNNLETADVMNKIQSALVGNYESVKSLGIVINKTRIETNAYETGLASMGEELTQAQLAQSALDLIMKGSADAQGDMARSAGSYALQLKQLKTNISELGIQIGQVLLPVATEIVTKINDWMLNQGGLNTLLNGAIEIIRGLYNAYQGIVIVLKSVVVAIAKFVEITVKGFTTILKPADWLLQAVEKLGGPKNPFDTLTEVVEQFSAASVENLTKTWEATKSFNQTMDDLKKTGNSASEAVKSTATETGVLAGSLGEATIAGGAMNDSLGTMVQLSDSAALNLDNLGSSALEAKGSSVELTGILHNMDSTLMQIYLSLLKASGGTNTFKSSAASAAQAGQQMRQSNDVAATSYDNLATSAERAAMAIQGANAASASAGASGTSGGQRYAKGYSTLPEYFTDEMAREYARWSSKQITTGDISKLYDQMAGPMSGSTAATRENFYNAYSQRAQQILDPNAWAVKQYGNVYEGTIGGITVNVNQELSKDQIAALIAELERAQARG